MILLGIDYGRSKIGLAIGDEETRLAEPLEVLRIKNFNDGLQKVSKAVEVSKVSKVVIGISEGEMGKESKKFGQELEKVSKTPVVYQDETLSTYDAQEKSIASGMNRKKRKNMEDAFAAALILQTYLDEF